MNFPQLDPGPFVLCERGERPPKPRPLGTPEGLGDRLRTAAFAEWQAITAFKWAAENFQDVPAELRDDWARQVKDEARHYNLIRVRMEELNFAMDARCVSTALWDSLKECESGKQFCLHIVSAEERGRQAAEKIVSFLQVKDPATAAVFQEIAQDEVAHVSLAQVYFGWSPS